jgi:hypothetical protein
MSNQHTIQDLASHRGLWEEYIDPDDQAPFDTLTQSQRENIIKECWPNEFDDAGRPIDPRHTDFFV